MNVTIACVQSIVCSQTEGTITSCTHAAFGDTLGVVEYECMCRIQVE